MKEFKWKVLKWTISKKWDDSRQENEVVVHVVSKVESAITGLWKFRLWRAVGHNAGTDKTTRNVYFWKMELFKDIKRDADSKVNRPTYIRGRGDKGGGVTWQWAKHVFECFGHFLRFGAELFSFYNLSTK